MSIVDEMSAGILADLNETWNEARKARRDDSTIEIINLIGDVVRLVEKWALKFKDITGEQKKEVAVKIINVYVDFPMCPEWLEAKVISYAVDAIINTLNSYMGRGWSSIVDGNTKA